MPLFQPSSAEWQLNTHLASMNRNLDIDAGGRNDQFRRVDIVKRFVALLLILLGLLVPGGSGPAMAAMEHLGQADCPHAAMATPSDMTAHSTRSTHPLSVVPSCCNALPSSLPLQDAMPELADAAPRVLPRPLSEDMPAQRAIGPDLPPPRA